MNHNGGQIERIPLNMIIENVFKFVKCIKGTWLHNQVSASTSPHSGIRHLICQPLEHQLHINVIIVMLVDCSYNMQPQRQINLAINVWEMPWFTITHIIFPYDHPTFPILTPSKAKPFVPSK